jgi:hypothetical protein
LEISPNNELARLAIAVERRRRGALVDILARNAKLQTESAFLVTPRNRNGKHSLSSEFWRGDNIEFLADWSSYVRALEMQQFKLVAGLQTMYTMLLTANSWPGSPLEEHKGNPLVHDILDRLGLLEYENDQELDLDMNDHDSDHQSNSDEASTIESAHVSQLETEESPKSRYIHSSASPLCTDYQQHLFSKPDELELGLSLSVDSWHLQPTQSQYCPLPSTQTQLPAEVLLKPHARTITSLSSPPPIAQSVEGMTWNPVDYSTTWWYGDPEIIQEEPYSSIDSIPAVYAIHMPVNNSTAIVPCHQGSLLVDPGVYASDFDVER